MTAVLDSSALFAYLYEDDPHSEAARAAIETAYREGRLLVNGVVYAELSADPGFESRADVDEFLADTGVGLESPSREAMATAGDAFRTYLSRRGDGFQCPSCGTDVRIDCPDCGEDLTTRQHLSPDFLIGAQAEVDADAIVTFDDGFYRSYFDVEVHPGTR